jgi:L-asparaginase
MTNKTKILCISTGGTIAMAKGEDGCFSPIKTAGDLLDTIPEIKNLYQVEIYTYDNIDSADISPPFWEGLADVIYKKYNDYDGFVITHGTDTMAYTASALSFFFQELNKPVVLTGSQISIGVLGSDGKRNLINAFRVAASNIAEVVIVFGSKIIRGTRARKISAFSLEAFGSINENPVGEIGLSLRLRSNAVRKGDRKLLYIPTINPNVSKLLVYPGFSVDLLDYAVEKSDGIVLLGYGTGNVPLSKENDLIKIIKKASDKGVPVIIGTQCILGRTNLKLYSVGNSVLNAGGIPSVDMTPEATLIKLMWILGQTTNMKIISSMIAKSYCGEISKM